MLNLNIKNFYNPKEELRTLVDSKNKLAIYWSPKAGCTTAAKIFLMLIGIYQEDIPIIEQRNRYAKFLRDKYLNQEEPQKTDRSLLCNQESIYYKNYIKVQIVRNPYSRAISSFLKYLEINTPIEMSFSEFLEKIFYQNIFEHHIIQQFMTNDLNFIIKLENFKEDIENFNKKYNIILPNESYLIESYCNNFLNKNIIKKYNKVKLKFSKNNVPFTCENNNIIYGIPEYKLFYDKKNKYLVEKIYKKDIEFFNYNYPYE